MTHYKRPYAPWPIPEPESCDRASGPIPYETCEPPRDWLARARPTPAPKIESENANGLH